MEVVGHMEIFSENYTFCIISLVPHASFCFFFKDLPEKTQFSKNSIYMYIYHTVWTVWDIPLTNVL